MNPLPPPRTSGHYSIGLVCLGNICRSPMADVVLRHRLAEAGLDDRVEVASCGTGDWHVGKPMDRRAAAALTAAGYDATRHRAQQYDAGWPDRFDVLLAMDAQNLADVVISTGSIQRSTGSTSDGADRVMLFRAFDPREPGAEVPDPYYGGDRGFEEVLAMVERTSDSLVASLRRTLVPAERG